jgi:hypothetical protein
MKITFSSQMSWPTFAWTPDQTRFGTYEFVVGTPSVWQTDDYKSTYVHVERIAENDEILKKRGWWVGAHVSATFSWPMTPHRAQFEGREFIILPKTETALPAVFVAAKEDDRDEAQRQVSRFLNAWGWMSGGGARVKEWTSGSHQHRTNVHEMQVLQHGLEWDFLPQNLDRGPRLALALFNEGEALDHPAFKFLSYFKVLNLAWPDGSVRGNWVDMQIDQLATAGEVRFWERDAKARIETLRAEGEDVGKYLNRSGRCAVAHATLNDVVVDPDDPADRRRISADLPLVRYLAATAIRDRFGVPTRDDIWVQKPYALEGFRACLGEDVVERLRKGETLGRRSVPLPSRMNLKASRQEQLPLLAGLAVRVVMVRKGVIAINLVPSGEQCVLFVELNFPDNRIAFDPLQHIYWADDGSSQCVRTLIELTKFRDAFMANDHFEMWAGEGEHFLGKTDPYIPVNIMFFPEKAARYLVELEGEAHRREASEASYAGEAADVVGDTDAAAAQLTA